MTVDPDDLTDRETENNMPWHLTPVEHYIEAGKCLFHASAAKFGSPAEDSYLRVASIHATLATVRMDRWDEDDLRVWWEAGVTAAEDVADPSPDSPDQETTP